MSSLCAPNDRAPALILEVGDPPAAVRETHGSFADWFGFGLDLPRTRLVVIDPRAADTKLPSPSHYSAVIISGSASMVTERDPFAVRLAAWIPTVIRARVPLLGVCYGHQILAFATGGRVDYHERGIEVGTVPIRVESCAGVDPLFGALPTLFDAQASHLQTVTALPPGATRLASNDHDPNHAYRLNDRTWGVQFHPEFSADVMRAYFSARKADYERRALDVGRLLSSVRATPDAASLLRRFRTLMDSR